MCPCTIAQRGWNSHYNTDNDADRNAFLTADTESIHKGRYDSFHNRNGAGQCSQEYKHKKQNSDNRATSHLLKYFRKCYKHQSCSACFCSCFTAEYINCRNDHKSGQQSNHCIKNLNLIYRFCQACLVFCIRAISDHDSHSQTHRIKHLSHGCTHCFQ